MSESEHPTGPAQQTSSPPTPPTSGPEPAAPPASTQGQPPTPLTNTSAPAEEAAKRPCPDPKPGPKPRDYAPKTYVCVKPLISCNPPLTGTDPQEQLTQLKAKLDKDKVDAAKAAQDAEKRKVLLADLQQRVASMEKTVGELEKMNGDYTEKYNTIYGNKRKIECWVAATRGQLDLSPDAKKCVEEQANRAFQEREDARGAYLCQQEHVAEIEKSYKTATDALATAKTQYDFLKTGLLEGVGKKVDELGKIQPVNPGKDNCLTYFYLNEMDVLLSLQRDPDGKPICAENQDPQIGTFLCCWPPDKYKRAYEAALVAYNNAEYVEKCLKADLEAEKKKLPDLDKAWKEAKEKRRERVVAYLAVAKCCEKPPAAAVPAAAPATPTPVTPVPAAPAPAAPAPAASA